MSSPLSSSTPGYGAPAHRIRVTVRQPESDDENRRFLAANPTVQSESEDSVMEDPLQEHLIIQHTELSRAVYSDIVNAAAEAATMSVFAALRSGAMTIPHNAPAPPQPAGTNENPSSDENQPEAEERQRFQRPRGRAARIPRSNHNKLLDEAMRDFLDQKGVRARKDYYPEPPDDQHVRAYEELGLVGPLPDAPRVCLKQTFRGKWNKAVLETLTTAFISAVEQGIYKSINHTWPSMQQEAVKARLKSKLYESQRKCLAGPNGLISDKVSRMYARRQETYFRRRKIYEINRVAAGDNDEAWNGVRLLLDDLSSRGMSDDETDDESAHLNPDRRFKALRRIDTGFLTPEIADIWAAVETYPSSAQLSRGNRSFKRNPRARRVSKTRAPIPGLPANFYNPEWLRNASPSFRNTVREDVALPVLVSHHPSC